MTEEEQIKKMRLEILQDIDCEDRDEIFKLKLIDAKYIALNALYPFHKEITELPDRYKNWQVRCAIELYRKMGEEGYLSYSENGLSYTMKTDLISESLMNELIPRAGVIK